MATVAPVSTVKGSGMAETAGHALPSSVDWAAILAGGLLAVAISFILLTFGSAIGLSLTSPYGEGHSLSFLAAASGLWVIWVEVSSFMAGAYLAGRLRRRMTDATAHEVEVRDGSHGLLVWALGVLVGAMVAASVASGVANTAASAVSTAAQSVGSGAMQLAGGANSMGYSVDSLFRTDNPQEGQSAADSEAQAARILATSAAQGSISGDDKTYLAQLITRRTGLSQPEAEQRIDRVMASIQNAADQAKAAADKARRAAVLVAFVTAASLVIGAAAAWWAAGMGGRHRDEGTDFSHLVSWR